MISAFHVRPLPSERGYWDIDACIVQSYSFKPKLKTLNYRYIFVLPGHPNFLTRD